MQHPWESCEILVVELKLDDDKQHIENEAKMDDCYKHWEPLKWLYDIDLAKEDIWNENQIWCEL